MLYVGRLHHGNETTGDTHECCTAEARKFVWRMLDMRLLPPGWQRGLDPASGVVYYYNPTASITQWEHPAAPTAAVPRETQPLETQPLEIKPLDASGATGKRAALEQAAHENPVAQPQKKMRKPDGQSLAALCSAAELGETAIVRRQLAAGVPVDAKGPEGKTALQLASLNGHANAVKELMAAGASLDLQNADGLAALHYACMGRANGHQKVSLLLIEKGANPTLQTADGKVPVSLVGPKHGAVRKLLTAAATARHTGCLIGQHIYGKAPGL